MRKKKSSPPRNHNAVEDRFRLTTPRLSVLPFTTKDEVLLLKMFTHSFIRRYLWDDQVVSRKQVEEILEKNQQLFEEEQCGLWHMQEKESKEELGFVGLWYFFEEDQPQLLYALYPEACGKGYATEAAIRIRDYAFQELGFTYLIASCDAPNLASQYVAKRVGLQEVETRMEEGKETLFFRLDA